MPGQPNPERAERHRVEPAKIAERRPPLTPLALFLVLLLGYILVEIRLIVVVFLVALLFSIVIERPVELLERRFIPRPLGILLVYFAIIGALVLFGIALVPELVHQAQAFANEAPDRLRDLQNSWATSSNPLLSGAGERLLSRVSDLMNHPPAVKQGAALGVITNVTTALVGIVSVFVMTFYMVMERAFIRRVVLMQVSERTRPRVDQVWNDVERKVGGWMRGQLLLALIACCVDTTTLGILHVPFWPLLGIFMGSTMLIPLLGSWISGIPAVTMALTVSWRTALIVLIFIIVRQMVFDFTLSPKIMKDAVGITPLTVVVAVLAGTKMLGAVGALLAIPLAGAIQVILGHYLANRRAALRAAAPETERPSETWRWLQTPAGPGDGAAADAPAAEARVPAGPASAIWQGDRLSRADLDTKPDGAGMDEEAPTPTTIVEKG